LGKQIALKGKYNIKNNAEEIRNEDIDYVEVHKNWDQQGTLVT
jgi:3-keto-L-gulonate-6-phosphate decarboxylase